MAIDFIQLYVSVALSFESRYLEILDAHLGSGESTICGGSSSCGVRISPFYWGVPVLWNGIVVAFNLARGTTVPVAAHAGVIRLSLKLCGRPLDYVVDIALQEVSVAYSQS